MEDMESHENRRSRNIRMCEIDKIRNTSLNL